MASALGISPNFLRMVERDETGLADEKIVLMLKMLGHESEADRILRMKRWAQWEKDLTRKLPEETSILLPFLKALAVAIIDEKLDKQLADDLYSVVVGEKTVVKKRKESQ
jgi:hypothetical protein